MAIIVATALGPHDHDARELAGILAKHMGETIILAHVLEQHEPAPQVLRELLDRATHEITRFGASAYHVLLRGDPTTALTDYARRIHPRLIVIGGPAPNDLRGRGQRRKARHLMDALQVPILCVPHAGDLMHALLEGECFHMLVRSVHDAKADAALLREAHALRGQLTCDVSVLCASAGAALERCPANESRYDLLVLDGGLLERETAWPFPEAAKPMLFVSAGEPRVPDDRTARPMREDAKIADA